MAANANAVLNYLNNVLQINDPDIRTNFVHTQGFDSWATARDITIDDVITMCKNMRRPGGTIQNPDANEENDLPERIPNPGYSLGFVQEQRLKKKIQRGSGRALRRSGKY